MAEASTTLVVPGEEQVTGRVSPFWVNGTEVLMEVGDVSRRRD